MFGIPKYEIKKVKLSNGADLAYIDEGSGEKTLVFIHGLANYAYSWTMNIERLKKRFRCIAIDLPGNGYSDTGDFDYSMQFFAGAVYDAIQKLQLSNVVLVGHSMGGQVAMTLALKQPDVCEQMVLCAPAGFEEFSAFERTVYKTSINFLDFFSSEENSLTQVIKASFYKYQDGTDEMIQELIKLMQAQPTQTYRRMIEGCIDAMINEPVFDELHNIRQDSVVIYGDSDALIPNRLLHFTTTQKLAEKAVAKMPNARLMMLDNCGHFVHVEKPEVVSEAIEAFIVQ